MLLKLLLTNLVVFLLILFSAGWIDKNCGERVKAFLGLVVLFIFASSFCYVITWIWSSNLCH
jgi:biotin transporter BioY